MFVSDFHEKGVIRFPEWRGVRVQLMPVVMQRLESIPFFIRHWCDAVGALFAAVPDVTGVGYLTIDERLWKPGSFHRRPGLHVDGMGAWGKGGGFGCTGMLMASNVAGCVAWRQGFQGLPKAGIGPWDPEEGCCEHLRDQCVDSCKTLLEPRTIYWCDPLCVHEVLRLSSGNEQEVRRTFVRLSMLSSAPWPENCTPNPRGVLPGGPICEARRTTGEFAYDKG